MNIAVLGARNIGSTLGRKWVQAGHRIMFGVRNAGNPELVTLLAELGDRASAGTVPEAIAFGDVVVFAIPGAAMAETIRAHARALAGKVVVDAANRMGEPAMNSAADFAAHAPTAMVFRAFNSLGWENFADPLFAGIPADLLYCGPDGDAQKTIEQLIADVGLRPIRVGGLDQVHQVDTIASLWFALAYGQRMGRRLAFKVLAG